VVRRRVGLGDELPGRRPDAGAGGRGLQGRDHARVDTGEGLDDAVQRRL